MPTITNFGGSCNSSAPTIIGTNSCGDTANYRVGSFDSTWNVPAGVSTIYVYSWLSTQTNTSSQYLEVYHNGTLISHYQNSQGRTGRGEHHEDVINVTEGDTIRVKASVTGKLDNTTSYPAFGGTTVVGI